MEDEVEPRVATSSQIKCIERFKELWSVDELKNEIIPLMNPNILKLYSFADMKISNHNKLAKILFDIVGTRFLRDIENNKQKRTQFVYEILRSAISKNMIKEAELVEKAKKINKTMSKEIELAPNQLYFIADLPAHSYWVKQLAIELGFHTSVAEKDSEDEEFRSHEHVIPTLDLNPLYDYQHSTGMEIRKMLEGRIDDKRILISVPTGAGKTRMIVETLIEWLNAGKPSKNTQQRNSKFILWIAQSHELCEQAVSAFKTTFQARGKQGTVLHLHRYWGNDKKEMPVSIGKLDDEYSERSVVVSTISSLLAVYKKSPQILERLSEVTSCIVIDEAHHSITNSYNTILEQMGFNIHLRKQELSTKGIILIGLTATPFRGSGDNVETKTLLRHYGKLYFPSIPYYEGEKNFKPHALIDCQTYSMVGHDVRIIGDRSYDRDGFIKNEDFKWKISKIKKFIDIYSKDLSDDKTEWTFEKERNVNFSFPEEGEYKITLEVTDNEGEKGESSVYIKVLPKTEDADVANNQKQKLLYRKLIQRRILCEVYHWVLKSGKIKLSSDDVSYLKKFKEFKPETINKIGNDQFRNKLILDTIHEIKTKYRRNKILFFGCSIDHSRYIANALKIFHNIEARYVDSKIGIDQRVDAIEQFRNGSVEVLCNYDVLTTGFDAPNINCVFVGRPIRSTLLYTQIIGRGMRGTKSGGTDDVLLVDIDDNFQLHGRYGNYGYDKNLVELGWKVYSEYWKPWKPKKPALAQVSKLYCISCESCGNICNGIEEISRIFEVVDNDELIEALDLQAWDKIPKICKSCQALEIEHAVLDEPEKIIPEPFTESDSVIKECPRCGIRANFDEIENVFGYRTIGGKQKPQSHCRKCRHEQLRTDSLKTCPFVNFLENQNNIQGNYHIILGLYAVATQNGSLPHANMEDACNTLLQYNPSKTKSQINKNHSVFAVYYKNSLIKEINAITGDITFAKILELQKFEHLCNQKLHEYEEKQKQKQKEPKVQSSELLDDHFYKLKNYAFGHVPTYSQYDQSTSSGLKTLMHHLYGGYDAYLKAKGESVLNDPKLQDTLYEEYFELYSKAKSPISPDVLDEYGDYRLDDYVECFGSYENFDAIVQDIISKTKDISMSITVDDLFQDCERITCDLGRIPHFEEVRRMSNLGIEYYLQHFGTLGRFIKIYNLAPESRYLIHELRKDFYRLKELLHVVPNFRHMKQHSEYGQKLEKKYGEDNYNKFLEDLGEPNKPFDDNDVETTKSIRENMIEKFHSNVKQFGEEKAVQMLHGENSIPYAEWFGSKEQFLELFPNREFLTMYEIRKMQKATPKESLEKKSSLAMTMNNISKTSCPTCGSNLEKFDGGVACTNKNCSYYYSN